MIRACENVTETAKKIISSRPVFEPIIKAFEDVLEARANMPKTLIPLVKETKISLPNVTEEYSVQGRSLLSGVSLKGFDPVMRASAKVMLPLLAKQEHLGSHMPNLEKYFLDATPSKSSSDAPQIYELAEAYIGNDVACIEKTAKALDVPAEVLIFVFHFILGPALHALVMYNIPSTVMQDDDTADAANKYDTDETGEIDNTSPWGTQSAWKEGYCPVCASFPSLSYLDRALLDENNQYLASGGGKKYLHCSLCGTDWHFPRGKCPACSKEGPETMEILREAKTGTGERVDWCTECKSYCPNIDLRVRGVRPDFDTMALGMVHLDMIAAEKGLTPICPSFWNTF